MLTLLADENFNKTVLDGLLRRNPEIDVVRVQEVGLAAMTDPVVLEWAARQKRVLLTQDLKTMPKYAYERMEAALPMSGVIVVNFTVSIKHIIEDLLLLVECSFEHEWENRIEYLPLK